MTIEKALPPGSPVEWLIELSKHGGSQRSKLLTVAAMRAELATTARGFGRFGPGHAMDGEMNAWRFDARAPASMFPE
jgi:hypothetical protein